VRATLVKLSRLVTSIVSHLGWAGFRDRCRRGELISSQRRIGRSALSGLRLFTSGPVFKYSAIVLMLVDRRGMLILLSRHTTTHKLMIASIVASSSRQEEPMVNLDLHLTLACRQ
jgi:hypothetical protein